MISKNNETDIKDNEIHRKGLNFGNIRLNFFQTTTPQGEYEVSDYYIDLFVQLCNILKLLLMEG